MLLCQIQIAFHGGVPGYRAATGWGLEFRAQVFKGLAIQSSGVEGLKGWV